MHFRPTILVLALASMVAGCTQFTPGTDQGAGPCPEGCPDGWICGDSGCQQVADTIVTDTTHDAIDVAEVTDTVADTDAAGDSGRDAADVGADDGPGDVVDAILDIDDVVDAFSGPPTGKPCLSDEDCDGAECVLLVSDGESVKKVCTGDCGSTCPVGTRCVNFAAGDKGALSRCEPFVNGLCYPCLANADCLVTGAQCLQMPGGGRFCTIPCEGIDNTCPYGFECKVIDDDTILPEYRAQCQPVSGGCDCVVELAQQILPCSVSNDSGTCVGSMTCYPEVGWMACTAGLPQPDVCDQLDNDCDGRTDEDFSFTDFDGQVREVGQACGTGVCGGGTVICLGDSATSCSTSYLATQENCGIGSGNGRDDDCDGTTDEDCSVADMDGDGVKPEDGDCDDFDAAFHPGAPEPCCPLSITDPVEALKRCDRNCNGSYTQCSPDDLDGDGYSNPSAVPAMRDCDDTNPLVHPGAPEICDDGVDNDCLGDGDLHCCYADSEPGCVGPFDNDGDHYVGAMDCNDSFAGVNPGAVEICDFVDNDCDGITDNGNPGGWVSNPADPGEVIQVAGGSVCGNNTGECHSGIWVCVHYESTVKIECVGGRVATEEICDDLDNDCDGETDEDFAGKGQPCDGDDLDQCANGVYTCNISGTGVECVEDFEQADKVDICGDGIDQDCDGLTDDLCFPQDLDGDGYLPPDDCDDTRAEVRPWAIEPCCDFYMSKEEALAMCDWDCNGMTHRCNPVDRDFDGEFDLAEGGGDCDDTNPQIYPGAPEKCGDGIDQDCFDGDLACDEVVDRDNDGVPSYADCNDNNGFVYPWADELCNGVDDNCDGRTDEGNPGADPTVTCGNDIGICRTGGEVCVHPDSGEPQILCVPLVSPQKEMCDGLDNNCNGRTDETFRDLGMPCDGPDSDMCTNGRFICTADGTATECGPELIENLIEVCDGLDNDCDGETDEDFTHEGLAIGAECEGWGLCGAGIVTCSIDGVRATCSTNWDGPSSQSAPEECDGLDNDCDNSIDNGMTWYNLPLGSLCRGIGECGVGHVECNPQTLKAVCSTNPDGSNPRPTREWCNGLDDDCDGHTDNSLVATEWDCLRVGVCQGVIIPANCVAASWNCDYSIVPDFELAETSCDNLDNDCDGITDEGFGKGEACDGPDYDKCPNGRLVCKADGTGVECGPETIENITESCNRKDDDCDGRTDEDFPVGELCDGPDDDQCKNGSATCAPDGLGTVCNNEWLTNIPEICNVVDDDCDGTTDEGFATGEPCDGPDEDLCEFGHMVCNATHDGVECYEDPEMQATDELCNNFDDDCDGTTDEGFDYLGVTVDGDCDGIGECGPGKVVCNPTGLAATCSTNPDGTGSQAVPELCDALDNDCDGSTDEELTWRGLAMGAPCVADGNCAGGTVVCSPTDLVATCSTMPNGTEPGATTEKCDGVDNDCDGFTDEDIVADISGCRTQGICLPQLVNATCGGTSGWICDYSGVSGYQSGTETSCDGLDNNCDGNIDEAWSIGSACDGSDLDMCANGTRICDQAKTGWVCNETGPDIAETCGDAVDNDCDGSTDEEGASGCTTYYYSADGDAFGVGTGRCLCVAGQVAGFVATAPGDCNDNVNTIYPGATELCNMKDDDCDGSTDEDPAFSDLGGPCDSSDPDTCANGFWVCSADKMSLECSGDYNSAELCNGRDDDCDGGTDEEWQIGQPCDGADADLCQNSTWICKGDGSGAVCLETINVSEKCNGRDDDCDGFTDENYPLLGQACDSGDADVCANGVYTCKANGTGVECVTESTSWPSGSEVCDGFDNNCNGSADENWATRLKRCDSSDTDTCRTGITQCTVSKISVECVGDVVCAPGATCAADPSEFVADKCLCGALPAQCSRTQGSTCTNGVCLCGTGPACATGKQCLSDGLGGYSCQ